MRNAKIAAISAEQDPWMRRATDASVSAAKDVVGAMGPIRPGTPVGHLVAHEWSWICSTVVWAWIAARAEQAATEGWNAEIAIRTTGLSPDPWLAGAVASILPTLFEALPDLDWLRPIGSWSKETVTEFLTVALGLIQRAIAARDVTEERIAGETSAAVSSPRMTVAELSDDCPF
jgi:hypothetical protein